MANSRKMAQQIGALFGVELTTVESISRALMVEGLRAPGGRGRGATKMTGGDVFNVSVALAAGVGMREAPSYVRSVVDMELTGGSRFVGDHLVWDAPTTSDGKFSDLLRPLQPDPLENLKLEPKFGSFVSGWIDGMFDNAFPWTGKSVIELNISNIGPTAKFKCLTESGDLRLDFSARGFQFNERQPWERMTIMRGSLFAALVKIAQDD